MQNSLSHTIEPTSRLLPNGSYRTSQQGVALVVVLLFLILIMLAGVMAVRQSSTDLKTANADQVNTVLLHSSESALQKLEGIVNDGGSAKTDASGSTPYSDAIGTTGVFGSFMQRDTVTVGNEYIYCYNPRTNQYTQANATIYQPTSAGRGTIVNNNGVCDLTKTANYTSDRQTTIAQVSVVSTSAVTGTTTPEAFNQMAVGRDSNNFGAMKYHFDIRATSILPSYNPPSDNCLSSSSIPTISGSGSSTAATTPLLTCLRNSNTPNKMVFEQADLEPETKVQTCLDFGADSTVKC